MSLSQPVNRVVERLASSGYVQLPQPLAVGGVLFEFAAILGRQDSLDLVVVVDTIANTDSDQTRRRIEALARALDVVGSRRTLTVVLVGVRPQPAVTKALGGVARVLAVGTPTGEQAGQRLDDALAVLLPLSVLTDERAGVSESWAGARAKLLTEYPVADMVINAAPTGSGGVADALHKFISAVLQERGID